VFSISKLLSDFHRETPKASTVKVLASGLFSLLANLARGRSCLIGAFRIMLFRLVNGNPIKKLFHFGYYLPDLIVTIIKIFKRGNDIAQSKT